MFLTLITSLFLFNLSFAQWNKLSNYLIYGSQAIDSPNSNTIVFIKSDTLIKSVNGGNSWIKLKANELLNAVDISAIDESNIWVGSSNGKIYNTSDGGQNWTTQFSDASVTPFINYIEMFDAQNGIAMGDATLSTKPAIFLKTSNGGQSWISQNSESFGGFSGDIWRRMDFVNPSVGYFLQSGGSNPQKIFKTVNGGQNWIELENTGYAQILKFYSENVGYYYNNGTIFRTTDGGATWTSFSVSATGSWGMDIEFPDKNDPSKIYVLDDKLYFSSDSGKTWIESMENGNSFSGRDIVFSNNEKGWVLGNSYLYTTNLIPEFVVTGIKLENSISIGKSISLEQNYPNPFNPNTVISYYLFESQQIDISVYNIIGQKVATLINSVQSSGHHTLNFKGSDLPSGIYVYRLQSKNENQVKIMHLVK